MFFPHTIRPQIKYASVQIDGNFGGAGVCEMLMQSHLRIGNIITGCRIEARGNNGACPTNFAFAWNRSRTGPAGKTFIGREFAADHKTVSTVTSK